MSSSPPQPASFQRNALAPGLLAAIALFLSPLLADGTGATIIRFVVAILALIVAWFALQAKQWWWTVVFVAVAVVWNPVYPLEFSGPWWIAAQIVGAVLFLLAGALIKNERAAPQ